MNKLSYELLEEMLKRASWEVAESLLPDPIMSSDNLERLALSTDDVIRSYRYWIADNPNLSVSTFRQLAKDDDVDVSDNVYSNPNCPLEILEQHLPLHELEHYATSNNEDERYAAARNPRTPSHLLEKLSYEENFYMDDIARNPNATMSLLRKLANHKEDAVRQGVARNPTTPVDVLVQLVTDKYDGVRVTIAERTDITVSIIEQLAKDSRKHVREVIAGRADTPETVLEQMAWDKSPDVRRAVAGNPNTPLSSLRSLILDANKDVRGVAAGNPRAAVLFNSPPEPDQPIAPDLLKQIVRNTRPSLARFIAFLQPDCPVEALAKYFRSPEWRERCAIAMNPNTPPNTIEKLLNDGNRIVREAARNRTKVAD